MAIYQNKCQIQNTNSVIETVTNTITSTSASASAAQTGRASCEYNLGGEFRFRYLAKYRQNTKTVIETVTNTVTNIFVLIDLSVTRIGIFGQM